MEAHKHSTQSTVKHNIRMYYGYSTFSNLLILGPILTLFFLEKGLNFTQIMVISAVSAIGTVLFEVPTGMMADRIGRKYSLILNAIFWAITCLIYMVSDSFLVFLIGEVFFSIGAAFGSGADSALLYDTLKSDHREGEYQKIEGKSMSLVFYSQAIGSILAGYLYKVDIRLPFALSFFFVMFSIWYAYRFVESPLAFNDLPSNTAQANEAKEHPFASFYHQFHSGCQVIIKNPKLLSTIATITIMSIFFRGSFPMYQPYMKAVDIDVVWFGWLFFAFNIIAAQSSKFAHRFMTWTKSWTLIGMGLLIVASYLGLGLIQFWGGVALIGLQQIYRGMSRPIFYKYYNKRIPSELRATVLSTISFVINLGIALIMPLQGLLMDRVDIFTAHLILSVLLFLLLIPAEVYMRASHRSK